MSDRIVSRGGRYSLLSFPADFAVTASQNLVILSGNDRAQFLMEYAIYQLLNNNMEGALKALQEAGENVSDPFLRNDITRWNINIFAEKTIHQEYPLVRSSKDSFLDSTVKSLWQGLFDRYDEHIDDLARQFKEGYPDHFGIDLALYSYVLTILCLSSLERPYLVSDEPKFGLQGSSPQDLISTLEWIAELQKRVLEFCDETRLPYSLSLVTPFRTQAEEYLKSISKAVPVAV